MLERFNTSGYDAINSSNFSPLPLSDAIGKTIDSGSNEAFHLSHTESFTKRKSTYFGRHGSDVAKYDLGVKVPENLQHIRVEFIFDESAYTTLDIELYAFVFNKKGEYLDCIFYKNLEGCDGISYESASTSFHIHLNSISSDCAVIVFAVAVQVPGMKIPEIEGGMINIYGGILGDKRMYEMIVENVFELNNNVKQSAKIFVSLIECMGMWYLKNENIYSSNSLHEIMPNAKEAAERVLEMTEKGAMEDLLKLNELICDCEEKKDQDLLNKRVQELLRESKQETIEKKKERKGMREARKIGVEDERKLLPEDGGDCINIIKKAEKMGKKLNALKNDIKEIDTISDTSGINDGWRLLMEERISDVEIECRKIRNEISIINSKISPLFDAITLMEHE